MRAFAVLTILFAVLVGFTAGGGRHSAAAPTAPPTAPVAGATGWPGTGYAQRRPDGHFTVDGTVGGTALSFVVDTGASKVALSRGDAARVGLRYTELDFTGEARTAAGTVRVAPATLPRLQVGTIEFRDVPALVLDVPQAMPLLGQSFLARLDKVAIEGDRMTLTKL